VMEVRKLCLTSGCVRCCGREAVPWSRMNPRVRHKLSTSMFIASMRGTQACLRPRKCAGWLGGSFSMPAGRLDAGETVVSAATREAPENGWVSECFDHD
jgi:8-oxo-dGTP pyrophosphatase MutT (NUDIX family)